MLAALLLNLGASAPPQENPKTYGGKKHGEELHRKVQRKWEEIEAAQAARASIRDVVVPAPQPTRIARPPVIQPREDLTEHELLALFAALADFDD